ncbi:MAG: ABC transporter permease [Proteobacteria bacterium]|nr:ABC transporter permease [Pseudomonadota bacterium]
MWLITRRELAAILRSPMGFIVAALVLTADGLLFNTRALGGGAKFSTDVLTQFFFDLSGVTVIASIPISMRLLAEERQKGTIALLFTSPIKDYQIILGKFFGAYIFIFLLTILTIYMPLLVIVNGKVSLGHLMAGYLGTLLLAAGCLAIGIFGSALSRSQIIAVFISAFLLAAMVLFWLIARISDKPLNDIFMYLALHNLHFSSFKTGKVHLRDIIYYLSVCTFFLFAATRILESRRWR